MDLDLTDEQAMLRDLVSRFAADRYALEDRMRYRLEPLGFAAANWTTLAELGLLAMPFAEAHGGLGGGRVETITLMEGIGRALVAEPFLSDILLAARLVEAAGTAAQIERWLPPIMAGEARVALAHVEHGARFNELHVRCRAHDGRITGDKTFVQAGDGVDAYVVTARERGGDADAEGLALWIVDAADPGIEKRSYRLIDGSVGCELRFRAAPAQRMAGGADRLLAILDETRIAACAEMVGIASTLLDMTVEHLRTRRQFGQPIGSFQAVQHRMADLYVAVEQSRSQMLRAALLPDAGRAAVAAAKSFVSEQAVRLGEECIQFHGGMGVTNELAIGHGHKRILLLATLLGDAESELARYVREVAPR